MSDHLTYRMTRDPKGTSKRLLRLEFLRRPAAVQQATQAAVARAVAAEQRQGRPRPSELAVAFAAGMYDPAREGELEELERWAGDAEVLKVLR